MLWNTDGFAGPLAALCRDVAATLLPVGRALPVPAAGLRGGRGIPHATLAPLLARARADLDTAWPQPLASQAARVHGDGDRDMYEQRVFERQRRLSRAVVAALVDDDPRWLDEVADGVWLLAEQSSWCWPAHDDTRSRHGSVLATVTDPFLDLGAGEVVGQLAWIDHVLGARLDERYPGVRRRVRHEAEVRVFAPFLERRDWHWIGLDGDVHNWNPWIHGNVLVAALALCDDEVRRERLVALAAQGIDRYVAALPGDGAIDEGYAYWWNGACRALEALDLLAFATGGAWDPVAAVPALRETVAFPHRSHLGGPWYVNLADGPARPPADQPWHALHRAARVVDDAAAQRHAIVAQRTLDGPAAGEDAGLGRMLRALADREWLAATNPETPAPEASPLPRKVWLPSTQVWLARASEGSPAGLTVVLKGGHNDENHNHNDVGSVIVASDGVPVIVDAGRPTYTAQTFGPHRYDIWTMQSDWHSVPRVSGLSQPPGRAFAASDARLTRSDEIPAMDVEIGGAYPPGAVATWRRQTSLDRRAARVEIHDRWQGAGPATAVRLLLAGEVTAGPGWARVVPLDGAGPVRIAWAADAPHTLEARDLDDPMLSDVWGRSLTRLEIGVDGRTELRVTVEQERNEDERS
ncbi:heparinase II/III domain-containing protein [Microbacterium oleivorans]|uniref:Heparinase II/III family protein n=1 Tax=Microbacterium oleivorans TaxID=273677 RepID=A0A7D5EYC7_9MICO|nr:heparinase II/III family protein [Microbacterium oleivorans]QLD12390.1 heparinase II/III family protein [Microbacterium oleivorans]